MIKHVLLILLTGLLSHCTHRPPVDLLPDKMPEAVANNATAYLQLKQQPQLYTFNGLQAGKTYKDVTKHAFVWQNSQWHKMNVPEVQSPVLASVAVTVKQSVYLFGGYTVAADHSEKSIPHVWKIDGKQISENPLSEWLAMPTMPVPVDDAVALVYQQRYIYLISGWHDVDNVDRVQVFDTDTEEWFQASSFPLPPVFGHAGGIVDNHMIICDGVKVVKKLDEKQFKSSAECVLGVINPNDITDITWEQIPHHSGTAYYRMAATAVNNQIVFAAGSDNPYNFNGIGYNGEPAKPSGAVRVYDLSSQKWSIINDKINPSMDHRALLNTPYGLLILGGMVAQQQVTDQITVLHKLLGNK